MAKFVLDVEFDYDFDLIALVAPIPDYQLCLEMNKTIELELERVDSIEVSAKEKKPILYSVFEYYCEDTHATYALIQNKRKEGLLVPEQKQADFFLMIRDNFDLLDETVDSLKRLPSVRLAVSILPESLKSKENLIYF
jgi:hypothetical protein